MKLKNSGNPPLGSAGQLSSNGVRIWHLKNEFCKLGGAAAKTVLKVNLEPWKLAFYGQNQGETAGQVWDKKWARN